MGARSAGESEYWWKWALDAHTLETPEEVLAEMNELEQEFEARRAELDYTCREGYEASWEALLDRLMKLAWPG